MEKRLSPNDLAVALPLIDINLGPYSHERQKRFGSAPEMTGMGTVTFGGTRTYGAQGQPSDSDQDNDRSA